MIPLGHIDNKHMQDRKNGTKSQGIITLIEINTLFQFSTNKFFEISVPSLKMSILLFRDIEKILSITRSIIFSVYGWNDVAAKSLMYNTRWIGQRWGQYLMREKYPLKNCTKNSFFATIDTCISWTRYLFSTLLQNKKYEYEYTIH